MCLMRKILLPLIVFSSLGLSTHTLAAKKCGDLELKVQKILEAQNTLTRRGIRGDMRKEINKLLDEGVDIHPMFFQQVLQSKSLVTNGFKKKKDMVEHARKHGDEFEFKSEKQYLRKAEDFAKSRDENIMTFRSADDYYRYNPTTNEFMIVGKSNKVIGTYFKPSLRIINERRLKDGLPKFNSISEWFIKNKWERFNLNNNFKN
ncbi:hypothetical protein [Bacteriovorax sp. DB6_IX]|uniref:hypothetical protein n=1 Tax=Bacteriovorax sp. DB6_IX TaxID=1353530 RepID=UPI00038A338A|nr:hypothetical protein [Bacteriovorax sp. DB6_IX]EQC50483.1 hypothetical protein M901_2354 [Bacteriovorax sp. DB6_IX]